MKTHRFISVALLVLLLSACDKDANKNAPAKADTKVSAAAQAEAKAAAQAADPQHLANLEEGKKQAEELLKKWLDAQNAGDFSAYSILYADKFLGIKRVGARTFQFEHAGWLKDRKSLFRNQTTVVAKEPQYILGSGSVTIEFEQTWSTARFKDVGMKRIVLERKDGAVKIAREEMLSSEIADAEKNYDRRAAGQFMPLKSVGGHAYPMVNGKEYTKHLSASARYISHESAIRPVSIDNLPKKISGLVGGAISFYGPGGRLCESKVDSLSVLANVIPHFGEGQRWTAAGSSEATIATDLWRLSATQGGRNLVADVKSKAECKGAIWARMSSLPEPKLFTRTSPASHPVYRRFQKLPGYVAIQKQYQKETGTNGPWDRYNESKARIAEFERGDKKFVAIAAQAGAGCADFYGEFWAIWELSAGRTRLLTDGKNPGGYFAPDAAVDLNDDGFPEFISTTGVAVRRASGLRVTIKYETPSFDCGC